MDILKLTTTLTSLLGAELSDWEIDELAEKLITLPKDILREVMRGLPIIWPVIRHASKILSDTEAKTRLLIILSDGKPEDYDEYKGLYAIEDTRHALIEAKYAGIHPFCITVDKEAQEYMAHMYGEVNYIFLDSVAKLPSQMPEVYRNLTT